MGCGQPNTNDLVTRVFNIENELINWEQNLHQSLRVLSLEETVLQSSRTNIEKDQQITQMLKTVITLRYLNTRLLLYRPILIKFLELNSRVRNESLDVNMLHQLGSHNVQAAITTASNLIAIARAVVTATDARRKLMGAWWYTLYYSKSPAKARHTHAELLNSIQCRTGRLCVFSHMPTDPSWHILPFSVQR